MCRGTVFPTWQSLAIDRIIQVHGTSIDLLIMDDGVLPSQRPADRASILQRIRTASKEHRLVSTVVSALLSSLKLNGIFNRHILWSLYRSLGRKFSGQICDVLVDKSETFQDVPKIRCKVKLVGKYSQYFQEEDLERIKKYKLDVILRFGFNILRGEILETPRYGVWSFHHDDHLKYRGGPEGFWEIYNNDDRSGAMLQRLSEKLDDGTVICKDEFRTIKVSYSKNRNKLLMKTARWPADACFSILNGRNTFSESSRSDAPIYKAPGNGKMLLFILKLLGHKVSEFWKYLFGEFPIGAEKWAIGILKGSYQDLLPTSQPEIKWITPPAHQFFADPFLIVHEGVFYILFELFEYKTRGYLAYIESNDLVNFSEPRLIFDKPFHLSYPGVFKHDNRFYCIPEQYQSKSVTLYEAVDFPVSWKEKSVLIPNFAGVDPTIFHHKGIWWMFVSNAENDDETNLYLFFADSLEGPWNPHAENPVKSEFKRSRPAGPVFQSNGRLIRPSQNGTNTYGGSVILNEITELTKETYRERFFNEIEPRESWKYSQGLHTLSTNGSVTVIDAKYHLPERFLFFKHTGIRSNMLKNGVARRLKRLAGARSIPDHG